ncbi:MFS general substrate transporter [Aspergillus karnatakaensis]|uniref:MFS general substrate transporter n=1 Tax=Aspergillus karnatakaensis TaxID=1810916 RepID=UPI003CCDBB36
MTDCKPFIAMGRWSYFNQRERNVLAQRRSVDGSTSETTKRKITSKDILQTFSNFRLWMHVAITMLSTCALHVQCIDIGRILGALVVAVGLAMASDRTGHRGPFVLVSASWLLITWGCLMTVANINDKWHKYAVLILSNVCGVTTHILNTGWLLVNTKSDQSRSLSSAMIVIAANLGGLSGGQIYRADDAPEYQRAIRMMTIIGAAAWVVTAALGLIYYFDARRALKAALEVR